MTMATSHNAVLESNGAPEDHGQALDAYLVKCAVGSQVLVGAPLLQVAAVVNALTKKIAGHAQITQSVTPPGGRIVISDLTGRIHSIGEVQDVPYSIVTLSGTYDNSGASVASDFMATLLVTQDGVGWAGQGSFTYGGEDIDGVPVKPG
jgi:hypothetical protein